MLLTMTGKKPPPLFEAKPGIAPEFLAAVNKAPDTRIRVSVINDFCIALWRLPTDVARAELEGVETHQIIFDLFVSSCIFHQTVSDIIGHVTDTFVALGPDSLRIFLIKSFQARCTEDSLRTNSNMELYDRILDRKQLKELLLENTFPTIYSFLSAFFPSASLTADGSPFVEAEIKSSKNAAVALKLVDKMLETTSGRVTYLEINRKSLKESSVGLRQFALIGGERHPELYIASVSLYVKLMAILGGEVQLEDDGSRGGWQKPSLALFNLTRKILTCQNPSHDCEDIIERIQGLIVHFPLVANLLVGSLSERLTSNLTSHAQFDGEKVVDSLTKLWAWQMAECCGQEANLSQQEATLATSLRVLSVLIGNWAHVGVKEKETIRETMLRLPATFLYSTYGQRIWILLLPVLGPIQADSLWTSAEILKRLPTKYFGVQIVQLLILMANPHDIAHIIKQFPVHRAFMAKSVLPVLIKRPGHLFEVFDLLSVEGDFEGYGPVLHALRSTRVDRQEAMRRELFQKYISGKADVLAVLADDVTRLEIFICFCDTADPAEDFEEFMVFVENNLDQQFLKFREPFMRALGRFFGRLDAKVSLKSKPSSKDAAVTNGPKLEPSDTEKKVLELFHLLIHQCNPSSSYARRTTSLQILNVLLSGPLRNVDASDLRWESVTVTLTQQIFWETFPDNLALIVDIFSIRPELQITQLVGGVEMSELATIANTKARSCAANDPKVAVSLGLLLDRLNYADKDRVNNNRILEVVEELRKDICNAKEFGMLRAARSAPIYGQLFRLRSLLGAIGLDKDRARTTVVTILRACWQTADLVDNALKENEARLSMDKSHVIYEENDDQGSVTLRVTAQQLFVCCWHCVREVAVLLGEVCCGKTTGMFVTEDEKIRVFDWMVRQLSVTRHTGAFEGLAEQIAKMARMFDETKFDVGVNAVRKTLDWVLKELQAWSSPLCPENSRKSAGLPRLLAILFVALSRTDTGREAYVQTMQELMDVASGKVGGKTDDRVRAIDILEALFRENALNEPAESFIGDGFMVACDSLASVLWPVRNSAAGLFTVLMQRVFGPSVRRPPEELQWREAALFAHKFFGKYAVLFDYFRNCLQKTVDQKDKYDPNDRRTSSSYCVLLVLQRLYPSVGDPLYMKGMTEVLRRCLGHPELRLRQAAAKATVLFLSESELNKCLKKFMTFHRLHGILLVAHELHRVGHFLFQFGRKQETFYSQLLQLFIEGYMDFSYSAKDLFLRLFLKFDQWSALQVEAVNQKLKKSTIEFSREERNVDPGFNMWAESFASALIKIRRGDDQTDPSESLVEDVGMLSRKIMSQSTSDDLAVRLLNSLEPIALRSANLVLQNGDFRSYLLNFPLDQSSALLAAKILLLTTALEFDIDGWELKSSTKSTCWERVMSLLSMRLESELLCVGLRCLSRLLWMFRKPEEDGRVGQLVKVITRVMEEVPTLEVRKTCADIVPCPRIEEISNGDRMALLDHWLIILKLLRDDSQEVRYNMAGTFSEFNEGRDRPYLPVRTISLALHSMVHAYAQKNLLVPLIHRITSCCIEEAEQEPNGERDEDDEEVFKPVDRHEYQEGLWLIDRLYDCVIQQGRLSDVLARQTETVNQMVEEVGVAAQLLTNTEFLDDPNGYSGAAFRLYCLVAGLCMIDVTAGLSLPIRKNLMEKLDGLLAVSSSRTNSLIIQARKILVLHSSSDDNFSSSLKNLSL